MTNIIEAKNITKEFSYPEKTQNWFKDLISPKYKSVKAVDNIDLVVKKGESVAFIGPNGAGKSTTIKMLTGILVPTSGNMSVAGYNPVLKRGDFAKKIGIVFAQRSQLIFNLPLWDSFNLYASMYDISANQLKIRFKDLAEIFDLQKFLPQPVRKLSLGQRMRAEIALSLLHNPEIIFLDEPTVGLDIIAKRKLRNALRILNQEQGVTIFLTSHDVGDIEAVSNRTIIINDGKIILDNDTQHIRKLVTTKKLITIEFEKEIDNIYFPGLIKIAKNENIYTFELNTTISSINELMKYIVEKYEVLDINIDDPQLEDIISQLYQRE